MIEIFKLNENNYFKYISEMDSKKLPRATFYEFCIKFRENLFGITFDGNSIRCYNVLKGEIEDFNLYNFNFSTPKENLPESVRKELSSGFKRFHISLSFHTENALRNLLIDLIPEEFL